MNRTIRFLMMIVLVLFGFSLCFSQVGSDSQSLANLEKAAHEWSAALEDASYATRRLARYRLLELATRDEQSADIVRSVLRLEIKNSVSMETLAAGRRILAELDHRDAISRLDRFLYDPDFQAGQLAGWQEFSQYAGDSGESRLLFAEMLRRGIDCSRLQSGSGQPSAFLAPDNRSDRELLETIAREDVIRWCFGLVVACKRAESFGTNAIAKRNDAQLLRWARVLRHEASGPLPKRGHHKFVLKNLVSRFVESAGLDTPDRLTIALRFGCTDVIRKLCNDVLNHRSTSAPQIVVALLIASSPHAPELDIDRWLNQYSSDERVSHLWRSMVPDKKIRQTQVGDVALALKLHRQQIDPRKAGYDAVIADPTLTFQP
ncbi:MAG: hypothetical protein AAF802_15675, partial [Planctomycetota bacterium]